MIALAVTTTLALAGVLLCGYLLGRIHARHIRARRRGGMLPTPAQVAWRWRIQQKQEPYDRTRDPLEDVRMSVGHPLIPAAPLVTEKECDGPGHCTFRSIAAAVSVARAMDIARDPHSRRVNP